MFKGLKTLLAGLVAGTVVGILFAPKKGTDLRKEFKKEIDKGGLGLDTLKETVAKMGKDISESGEKAYRDASKNESFKNAEKEFLKHARTAKGVAQDLIKEKVPARTRRDAKKKLSQAKDFLSKYSARAKRGVNKVASKLAEKTGKHEE